MPIRASNIDDHDQITAVDRVLSREGDLYPATQPIYGLIFASVLKGGDQYPREDGTFADKGTRFYSITSQTKAVVGFLVLQNWLGLDATSRQLGLTESDTRILYLGILPEFRRNRLGSEALAFALDRAREQNPRGHTIVRLKPFNAIFAAMVEAKGFLAEQAGEHMIAYRFSSDEFIRVEQPRK